MSHSTEVTTTGAIVAPDLSVVEGQITTTSRQIAEHFGKRHDTVLRSIRNLECSPEFHARNFAEMVVAVEIGNGAVRRDPAFRMTRDGFVFLAMGFTGKDAAQWKEAYIEAFNKMESELLARSTRPANPAIDYDRISPAQAQDLKELVHNVVDAKVQGFGETWARLHKKFRVNSYLELPATRFEDARDYLLGKLPETPYQPVNPLNAPELTAARKVAEEYFDNFREAVKAGKPNPSMGEIPQDVLHGMVSRAVIAQRTLSWFDWQTGRMCCKLVESDASVFSLTSGDYNDLMDRVPMERVPEMLEAINRRVASHIGAFSDHLKRNRKPAVSGGISMTGVIRV